MKNLLTLASALIVSASVLQAAPANDDFANRTVISGTTASGTNVGATREGGEPVNVQYGAERSILGANSVWWAWTPAASGAYSISTSGSSFDTQLGVYTGSAFPLAEVASNEDSDGAQAALTTNFVAGTAYAILVAGFESQSGTIQLAITPVGGGGGGTNRFTVGFHAEPVGGGTISVTPAADTDGKYASGTVLTVTAIPNAGNAFVSWSGDLSGSQNPAQLTVAGNQAVTANFQPVSAGRFRLELLASPASGGAVTASPLPGTDGLYASGQTVTLTAAAAPDFTFTSWSGDASGNQPTTTITLNANKSAIANFSAVPVGGGDRVQLVIQVIPPNGGTVQTDPAPAADGKYATGSTVTLTASPSNGYHFVRWSNGASGSANPLTIHLDTNTTVAAQFDANQTEPCPKVAIIWPPPQSSFSQEIIQVRGVAWPRERVKEIQFQLNDGPFQTIPLGKTWSATVSLQPGENRFAVKAIGVDGCESPLVTRVFFRESAAFMGAKGEYNGLIFNEAAPSCESSGFFNICVTERGTFSARLRIDGTDYRASGRFEPDGSAAFDLSRDQSVLHVRLHIDPTGASSQIEGTVQSDAGGWTSALTGDRRYYSGGRGPRAPQAGKYDFKFDDGRRSEAKANVDLSGNVSFRGKLSDGSKFEERGFISREGNFPFYESIRRSQKCLIGWLHFPEDRQGLGGTLILLQKGKPAREIHVSEAPHGKGKGRGNSHDGDKDKKDKGHGGDKHDDDGEEG